MSPFADKKRRGVCVLIGFGCACAPLSVFPPLYFCIVNYEDITLLEKDNVLAGETKVVVLLEEGNGGRTGGSRGHDVPGDGNVGSGTRLLLGQLLELDNALGLDLEERLVRGQADVIASLGSRGAETSALAASKKDHGDLVLGDLVETNSLPFLDLVLGGFKDRVKAFFGQRCKGGGLVVEHGRGAGGGLLVDPVDTLDIEVLKLLDKLGLLRGGEVVVVGEEMGLTGSLVALAKCADVGRRRRRLGLGGLDREGWSGNHCIGCTVEQSGYLCKGYICVR